jgi:hypothetical protein
MGESRRAGRSHDPRVRDADRDNVDGAEREEDSTRRGARITALELPHEVYRPGAAAAETAVGRFVQLGTDATPTVHGITWRLRSRSIPVRSATF